MWNGDKTPKWTYPRNGYRKRQAFGRPCRTRKWIDLEDRKKYLNECASALLLRLERMRPETVPERIALNLRENGVPSKA